MSEEIVLTGIVLYTSQLKEFDKRLVILTLERGKVTVFANGARRPNSNIRAASQSYVMGKFTVSPGRDSYTLHSAEVQEYFTEISQDMNKLCYAAYFCEFMSYFTREGDYCKNNLNLLYMTLKALVKNVMSEELIRYVYELKLLDIEGQGVHTYSCVKCSSKEDAVYFDVKSGGTLCRKCAFAAKVSRRLSSGVIYTIQYIMSAPLNRLYSFSVTDEIKDELIYVADSFRDEYVDKKFNSLEILKGL